MVRASTSKDDRVARGARGLRAVPCPWTADTGARPHVHGEPLRCVTPRQRTRAQEASAPGQPGERLERLTPCGRAGAG